MKCKLTRADYTTICQTTVYIYVANESTNDVNVFFDDLTIMQTGLHTVEATDYYPFGLVMSRYRTEKYGYGYQGQFSEEDEETGWNSFELRQYDPVIARWLSPDPYGQFSSPYLAMGNNPAMVDPDGGFAFPRLDLSFLKDAPAWTTTMGDIIINGGAALEFGGFTGAMSIAGAASSTISGIANINSFNKMVPINSQISMHQGNLDFGHSALSGGGMTAGLDFGGFKDVLNISAYLASTSTTLNELYRGHEFMKAFGNDSRRALNKAYPGRFKGLSANTLSKFADYNVAKAVAKGFSKPLLGVGIALTAVDVYQNDFSASSIAWGAADTGIAIAAIAVSGPAAPFVAAGAAIYFTGRFAYGVYEAYNGGK